MKFSDIRPEAAGNTIASAMISEGYTPKQIWSAVGQLIQAAFAYEREND